MLHMRSSRRLTRLDVVILLSATALGFGAARGWMLAYQADSKPLTLPFSRNQWELGISVMLSTWSLTLLGIGLRHPRPPLRRLMREPGIMAGCAVLLELAIGSAWNARWFQVIDVWSPPFALTVWAIVAPDRIALTVAGAWLGLLLSSRWRPERSWDYWLGRVIGASWIVDFCGRIWLY